MEEQNTENIQAHYQEYLMIKGYSKRSIQTHDSTVRRFKRWIDQEGMEAEQTQYNDMLAYVKSLQRRGVKQRTVQLYLNVLKHYFTFLQTERKIIAINPVENIEIKGIKRRRLYDQFTEEELTQIYQNYQANTMAEKRNKNILGLMVYQGLKTEELGALQPEDLKLREGKIYVPSTRRSNARKLNLQAFQIIDLQEYIYTTRREILTETKKESTKLFISMGSGNRFASIIYKLMQTLKKQNKRIKSTRQIRSSVITNWLKHYNLRKVQQMAGHRYVSSTEAYYVNDIEGLKEDIMKYHPI